MAVKNISLYGELLTRIKNEGLLNKTPSYYIKMFSVITLLSLATWGGMFAIAYMTTGWWHLLFLPSIILHGVWTAQYAFMGHELAHQQVFQSKKMNEIGGMIVANLFAGLSYGFWLQKHNRHHGKPNMIDSDPDINLRVIAFSTEQKYQKPSTERLLTRHQGWLFPALVFFTAFDLLLDSFKSLGRTTGRGHENRFIEGAMLLARLVFPLAMFSFMMPLWAAPIAWFVYMLAFGAFMGTAFAVNHIGMPLVEKGSRVGFFERQVLTSRNIKPNFFNNFMLGGLGLQVEHHLFPSMARPHLRKASKIVKAYCEEINIKYTEMSFPKGFAEVVIYLQKVGSAKDIDPFICPLVASMRQTV